jgi:CheY-like chemotaxis protein
MPKGRKHLVLIEDVRDNLEVLRAMLEGDFDIAAFTSCQEALDGIQELIPDLLLMDIGMADIDGIECLKRIRSVSSLSNTPAIAITAYAYPEDKARCLAAGFRSVVTKPVLDQNGLLRLIHETLG